MRQTLRSEAQFGAQLVAIWSLGVLQPLLSTLDDDPAFFVAHDAGRSQIITLVFGVAIVAPVVVWLFAVVVGWAAPPFRTLLRFVSLHGLLTILAAQLLDWLPHWSVTVTVAIIIAGAATIALERSAQLQRMATLLALAPALFIGQFLFASSVTDVLFPDEIDPVNVDDLLTIDEQTDVDTDAELAVDTDPLETLNDRFPSIFIVVLDEFPTASALDADGDVNAAVIPRLADFTESAHFWRDATTSASHTPLAVPALLTGQLPRATAAPTYSAYPQNLFTLLGGVYESSLESDIVDMCSPSICTGTSPIDLAALRSAGSATSTTTPTVANGESASPEPATQDPNGTGDFGLLLSDTLTVLGHTIVPNGLDIGLAPIDQGFTNFGGDRSADEPESEPAPSTTAAPTTTTTPLTSTSFDPTIDRAPPSSIESVDDFLAGVGRYEFLQQLAENDQRVDDYLRWVDDLEATGAPQLRVQHVLLPHVPWRFRPDGSTYPDPATPGYSDPDGWPADPTAAALSQQRHLLQLGFADQLLGIFFDRLEELGLDDSIIVITADHGISFEPGTKPRDPTTGADPIASVPLWIHTPGQREAVVRDQPETLLDIVPTIAELVGVEIPWDVDGTSLFTGEADIDRGLQSPEGSFSVATPGLAGVLDDARTAPDPHFLVPPPLGAPSGRTSALCIDIEDRSAGLVFGTIRGTTRAVDVGLYDDGWIATSSTFTFDGSNTVLVLGPHPGTLYQLGDQPLLIADC